MSKTLRVGLAMGGGVSMGTFSGAALTESLKLLLLYGQDEDGVPYDHVVVDCMSGASAGAIALGIMLRALLDYESVLKKVDYQNRDEVVQQLKAEHPILNDPGVARQKMEDLVALQVAQRLQEKLWVELLKIETLFGDKMDKKSFKRDHAFGLLDRKNIMTLVDKYLCQDVENIQSNTIRVVNKDRFLFACSLSNLTPIQKPDVMGRYNKIVENDSRNQYEHVRNLLSSVSSYDHAELRVIDFIFSDIHKEIPSDERWLSFCTAETFDSCKNDNKFGLRDPQTWKILSASTIACGAFPLAFEPVLLKRYYQEFGKAWPQEFQNLQEKLNPEISTVENKSKIDKESILDYNSFNFAYVDGGTFNNEPIKEAFKMSYFQDFHNDASKQKIDRVVLFVDPIVPQGNPVFQLPTYATIRSTMKDGKLETDWNSELSKAASVSGSLIGMLTRQGSIKEEHKSDHFIENASLNYQLQAYLAQSTTIYQQNPRLIKTAIEKTQAFLEKGMIPAGTRYLSEYFHKLMNKEIELDNGIPARLIPIFDHVSSVEVATFLVELKQNSYQLDIAVSNTFPGGIPAHSASEKDVCNAFLKLFLLALSDIGLETLGKNVKALRVGITPHNNETLEVVALPGTELYAFGGFMDENIRRYGFRYGKLCALNILSDSQFRQYHNKALAIVDNPKNCPLIDHAHLPTLKTKFKNEIHQLRIYESGMDQYSEKLFKTGFDLAFKRIRTMIDINKFEIIGASFISFLSGTLSLFKVPLFDYLLKWFAKSKLSVDNQRIVYGFQPIFVQIRIPDHSFLSLNYKSHQNSNYRSLNFQRRTDEKNKEALIELQLHMNLKESSDDLDHKLYAVSHTNIKKVDPNLNKFIIPEDPITEFKITNYWNMIPGSIEFILPIQNLVNDRKKSIFYSLKALNYHINPMLKITIDEQNNIDVLFEEGTTSFELLDRTNSAQSNNGLA